MSRISIIIPNLNSPVIDHTLAALRKQTLDLSQVEILVVGLDQPGLVKPDGLVKFISSKTPANPAQNRNRGIVEAQGDIFCFIDADCIPELDWLACLTARYADETISVIGGSITFDDDNYWVLCDNLSWFYKSLPNAPVSERSDLATLNLSVRRNVVNHIGPFNEGYVTGEDMEWTMRMRQYGYKLYFEPRAIVRHCAQRNNIKQVWQHAYQFGQNSPKINSTMIHSKLSFRERFLPGQWWLLLLLTPLLSLLATARIIGMYKTESKVWKAAPGIWLSKIAWCLGGTAGLFKANKNIPGK